MGLELTTLSSKSHAHLTELARRPKYDLSSSVKLAKHKEKEEIQHDLHCELNCVPLKDVEVLTSTPQNVTALGIGSLQVNTWRPSGP